MTQGYAGTDDIIVDRIDAVLRITMNNPSKRNALSRDMYHAMVAALDEAAEDKDVRAVLIRGTEGVFTAGNDVTAFNAPPGETPAPALFVRRLMSFDKPIVAQVDGLAIGIGVTMLLHCDIIYAVKDARFKMPFVNLGVVPEAGSSYLMPRLMGTARASELILLGREFDGEEAFDLGVISRVIPKEELEATAQAAAVTLTKQPPHSLKKSREFLKDVSFDTLEARVEEEFKHFFACTKGPEFEEALNAFLQKRAPDFSKFY
jgi:enoyl-CoA hydratase/carnithine racemase